MSATAFPASRALPPPKAMTPSWSPARSAATPAWTLASTGLARTSEKTAHPSPASSQVATAFATIGRAASPGSVTSRGRPMPSSRQAIASSRMRPAPKRIEVG